MVWRDLTAPERDRQGRPRASEHRQLIERRRLQLGRGGAAGRPRPHARRALLPPRPAPTCATTPTTSSCSASWATARRWRSTTPASTEERDRIAQNLQRGLRPPRPAEVAGPRHLRRLRGRRRGDRDRRRPLRRAADRGRLLDHDRRRRRQGQRRRRRLGRAAPLDARPGPRDRRARRGAAPLNELLLDGDSLNDFATAMLLRLRRDGRALASSAWPRRATRRRST